MLDIVHLLKSTDGHEAGLEIAEIIQHTQNDAYFRDLQDENENLAYENRRMGDFLEHLGYSIDTITDLIINGRQEDWEELLKDKNVNKNTKQISTTI